MKHFFQRLTLVLSAAVIMSTGITIATPVTAAAHSPCPYTKYYRVICANKTSRMLYLFENGRQVMSMSARFGGSQTPTREGTFKVYWKNRDHVSSLYGSAMPFSMFFSGGQAIHYSSDFVRNGYSGASHGCVNLRSWSGAQSLYNRTPTGTPVVVYRW
jgi:lipoprotein-anchoring transpeptidase ErfK/SrfK